MKIPKHPVFSLSVFESIRETIGKLPPESGGMVCEDLKTGVISRYYFDAMAQCTDSGYSPDTESLNGILAELDEKKIRLCGFPHSHPPGWPEPSNGDEEYAAKILAANPHLPRLVIPIIDSTATGRKFKMRVFTAVRRRGGVRIRRVPLKLVETEESVCQPDVPVNILVPQEESVLKNTVPPSLDWELFARVADAYDLSLLAKTRLVWVGVGGSAGSLDDLARAGVGQVVLIDPGIVERCNLATQAYFLPDIGRPKVSCLAHRLRAINPSIAVRSESKSLHDVSDSEFSRFAFDDYTDADSGVTASQPLRTVIVGATDDFYAQARLNRLSLHFALASVCCQLYKNALAGEVTFTSPEPNTTRACHRCILSSRFRAYLNGYRNAVGSAGSPICSTARLNALTTWIILAIIHHGTTHPHWGGLLQRIGARNLIQVRNHPDAERELGLSSFSEAFANATDNHIFADETVWRSQAPEHPNTGYSRPCPDCGGTGRLIERKGAFTDTKVMIPEP